MGTLYPECASIIVRNIELSGTLFGVTGVLLFLYGVIKAYLIRSLKP